MSEFLLSEAFDFEPEPAPPEVVRNEANFNEPLAEPLPAPWFSTFNDSEAKRTVFALRLETIASLPGASEEVKAQRLWALRLLQGVLDPAGERTLEIRYAFGTSGTKIWLVGHAVAPGQRGSRASAEGFWSDLSGLLSLSSNLYGFSPILRSGDLRRNLAQVPRGFAAELARDGRWHDLVPEPRSLGLRQRPDPASPENDRLLLPAALRDCMSMRTELCNLSRALTEPLIVSLQIRAGGNRDELAEAVLRLSGVADAPAVNEQWCRGGLEAHLFMASRRRPTPGVLNLVGCSFLSPVRAAWTVREEGGVGHRPWGLTSSAWPCGETMRGIYSLEEASALAFLPTTEGAKAAGLPVVPKSYSFLPDSLGEKGVLLGRKSTGKRQQPIHLQHEDRSRHVYVVGQTGTGKTTLLSSMILSDARQGHGFAVLDPHGDLVDYLLPRIPEERVGDVILFDPADIEFPMGLNLLEAHGHLERDFLIQEALLLFYRLFDPKRVGMIGPQWEHWFRSAALTLMSSPQGGTLVEIPSIFLNDDFRKSRLAEVDDPIILDFWSRQMSKTTDFHRSDMMNYFVSKFGRFRDNGAIRNIIGQPTGQLPLRELMDNGKILLVNLSRGRLGEMNSSLLGTILVTRLYLAALRRADQPVSERRPFCLYIDEFQLFTTETLGQIVSECRKFGLSLVMAHQNLAQLETRLRQTVHGNAGSLISFRPGLEDARSLAPYFHPRFGPDDLLGLPNHRACARLLKAGIPTESFVVETVIDEQVPRPALTRKIRESSRRRYARPRSEVEDLIALRLNTRATERPPQQAGNGLSRLTLDGDLTPANKVDRSEDIVIDDRYEVTGCPTGFRDLDAVTAGLQPSNLIVIAARPAMGKTAFALSIALNCILDRDRPRTVAFLDLEMSRAELAQRLLWTCAPVNGLDVKKGNLKEKERIRISRSRKVLAAAPLYLGNTSGITVPEFKAQARWLQKRHGLDVVMIDYLQLIRGSGNIENRDNQIADILRQLKDLAQDLNVPVITFSQVVMGVDGRQDKRPRLSDLRECDSGSIEQYVDMVAFIYRDEYYNPHSEDPNVAEIIIAKHPNGAPDTVKLSFVKRYALFHNLKRKREPNAPPTRGDRI